MHGLAVVAQSLLREPFRVADGLGAFRPGVAVAVERDAFATDLVVSVQTEPFCPGWRRRSESNEEALPFRA